MYIFFIPFIIFAFLSVSLLCTYGYTKSITHDLQESIQQLQIREVVAEYWSTNTSINSGSGIRVGSTTQEHEITHVFVHGWPYHHTMRDTQVRISSRISSRSCSSSSSSGTRYRRAVGTLMVNPLCDVVEGVYRGGRREAICHSRLVQGGRRV